MRKQSVLFSVALATLGVASPLAAQSPIGSPCTSAQLSQIYFGGTGIPTDLSYCGTASTNGNFIALSAVPRYFSAAPTTTGNGVYHALTGESIGAPNNVGFSSWNFGYYTGNIAGMPNLSSYRVLVDRDPSAGVNFIQWAAFTGNGFDSSNQGFVPGFDPFAVGTYTIQLEQYAATGALESTVAINVDVTSTVTPEPASVVLMGAGLFAVGGLVRRRNKQNAAK